MISANVWVPQTEESLLVREACWPAVFRGGRKANQDFTLFKRDHDHLSKASLWLNVHEVHPDVLDRMPLNGDVYDTFRTKEWLFDAAVKVTFFT